LFANADASELAAIELLNALAAYDYPGEGDAGQALVRQLTADYMPGYSLTF